jgi:hypothetical protein
VGTQISLPYIKAGMAIVLQNFRLVSFLVLFFTVLCTVPHSIWNIPNFFMYVSYHFPYFFHILNNLSMRLVLKVYLGVTFSTGLGVFPKIPSLCVSL